MQAAAPLSVVAALSTSSRHEALGRRSGTTLVLLELLAAGPIHALRTIGSPSFFLPVSKQTLFFWVGWSTYRLWHCVV